jgi:arylformamidase
MPDFAAGAAIDVSVTLRPEMPIYAGDPGVARELAKSIERGDAANVSRLELGAHTGTHVDAPCHFIPGGAAADELPLEPFIAPSVVVDATAASATIEADSFELPPDAERVLFKTANSRLWERESFTPDFVRLGVSAAGALIEGGVRLVGIDYLSLGAPDVHVALLGRGVGVIEGLDLRRVDPGSYVIACLPVKIAGSDGAPARVLLWPRG